MEFELVSFDLIQDDLHKLNSFPVDGCGTCDKAGCGGGGDCGNCKDGCHGDPIDP